MSSRYRDDDLLTTKQLAERWALSPGTLRNKRVAGTGCPYVQLGQGGTVRYRFVDVLACETPHSSTTKATSGLPYAHEKGAGQ